MKTWVITGSYGAPNSGASRSEVRVSGSTLLSAIAAAFDDGTLDTSFRITKFEIVTSAPVAETRKLLFA